MDEKLCMKCRHGAEHCKGQTIVSTSKFTQYTVYCQCRCGSLAGFAPRLGGRTLDEGLKFNDQLQNLIAQLIKEQGDSLMPNENYTINTNEPGPYRCLAYKPEVGADVTEEIMIADSAEQAQNLFAASVGVDAIKDGTVIKVFPMR